LTSLRATNKKNIIRTYDVLKDEDHKKIFIAMEYIDGMSLRQYMDRNGILPLKEALYIFKKILDGVSELHHFNQQIIHRDLKPENILLSHDLSKIKIIDFGIASVITKRIENNQKMLFTDEKSIYGTYPYICPDIFLLSANDNQDQKAQIISEQFDFYALGVILYEMLIGDKPFIADDYGNISVIKLPLKYDFLPMSEINNEVPNAIENIIFKCMACKKSDLKYRYHTIDEIQNDLNQYLNNPLLIANQPLIKPKSQRTYQINDVFNIAKQKQNKKFYEQQ